GHLRVPGVRGAAGEHGGGPVEVDRDRGQVVVERAARVAPDLGLVVHEGEQAIDAGAQVECPVVRGDDRTASVLVAHGVVVAGATVTRVAGAGVHVIAARGALEGGRVGDAALRVGARARLAGGLGALVRPGTAIVVRVVEAGAVVAGVVRTRRTVVAVE